MIREELYHKTVGILVAAYFNDTLIHGSCYACAVGNLVAANMGLGYKRSGHQSIFKKLIWVDGSNELPYPGDNPGAKGWGSVLSTNFGKDQTIDLDDYRGLAKEQIDSTGYSVYELAQIENAFENASQCGSDEDRMFNGLISVVEALDQIHENTDAQVKEESKKRFVKVTA